MGLAVGDFKDLFYKKEIIIGLILVPVIAISGFLALVLFSPMLSRFNPVKLAIFSLVSLLFIYNLLAKANYSKLRKISVILLSAYFSIPVFLFFNTPGTSFLYFITGFLVFSLIITASLLILDFKIHVYLENTAYNLYSLLGLLVLCIGLLYYSGFLVIDSQVENVDRIELAEGERISFTNISYTNNNFVSERIGHSTHSYCVFNESGLLEEGELGPGHYTSLYLSPGETDHISEHVSWDDHSGRGGDIQLETEDFEANELSISQIESCNEDKNEGLYIVQN